MIGRHKSSMISPTNRSSWPSQSPLTEKDLSYNHHTRKDIPTSSTNVILLTFHNAHKENNITCLWGTIIKGHLTLDKRPKILCWYLDDYVMIWDPFCILLKDLQHALVDRICRSVCADFGKILETFRNDF